jgi:hypothetical protein
MKTIPLTNSSLLVFVDDSDYEPLACHNWQLHDNGSACRGSSKGGKSPVVYMHREILAAHKGFDVDHKDRNRLNNTRTNLRIATRSQNSANSDSSTRKRAARASRFKGVFWHNMNGKWCAQITANQKHRYLGSFHNEEDAAKAYDSAARIAFGEFARPNFP